MVSAYSVYDKYIHAGLAAKRRSRNKADLAHHNLTRARGSAATMTSHRTSGQLPLDSQPVLNLTIALS
jgi:hypothetical protein